MADQLLTLAAGPVLAAFRAHHPTTENAPYLLVAGSAEGHETLLTVARLDTAHDISLARLALFFLLDAIGSDARPVVLRPLARGEGTVDAIVGSPASATCCT